MRKLLNFLLLVTASVVLMSGSCSGGDEPEPSPGPTPVNPDPGKEDGKLSVTPVSLTFNEQTAYYQTVTVSSPTASWSAKSDQEWCTASRKSTTELEIGVEYNYTTAERKATVAVTAGEQTAVISVTQAGSVATLTVSQSAIHFGCDGGQDSIVYIHCTPTYQGLSRKVEGGEGWLTVEPDDTDGGGHDYISVSAAVNETLEPRSATITVSLPGAEPHVITVAQDPGIFEIEGSDEYELGFRENEHIIRYYSTMKNLDGVTARLTDDTWLQMEYRTINTDGSYHVWIEALGRHVGMNYGIVKFKASSNETYDWRASTLEILLDGKVMKAVSLKQLPQPRLSVVASHGTALPSSGGTLDLKVYTNYTDWTLSEPYVIGKQSEKAWFTAERINDSTIRLTAPARQGTTPRPDCTFQVNSRGLEAFPVIVEKEGTAGEGYTYGEGTRWDGE